MEMESSSSWVMGLSSRPIVALIPFNYFTRKLAQLQFELESAATNVEVMVTAAKQRGGLDTVEIRKAAADA